MSKVPSDWHLFGVMITGVVVTIVLVTLVMAVSLTALV